MVRNLPLLPVLIVAILENPCVYFSVNWPRAAAWPHAWTLYAERLRSSGFSADHLRQMECTNRFTAVHQGVKVENI